MRHEWVFFVITLELSLLLYFAHLLQCLLLCLDHLKREPVARAAAGPLAEPRALVVGLRIKRHRDGYVCRGLLDSNFKHSLLELVEVREARCQLIGELLAHLVSFLNHRDAVRWVVACCLLLVA